MSKDLGDGPGFVFPSVAGSVIAVLKSRPYLLSQEVRAVFPLGAFLLTCARRSRREIKGRWVRLGCRGSCRKRILRENWLKVGNNL